MSNWWSSLAEFWDNLAAPTIIISIVLLIAGFVLARLISSGLVRLLAKQTSAHQAMLVRRISFYTILTLFIASALIEVGFDMSIFLGAAGILTVAIGFASQTSASNIISGLFLIGEKPFEIGEVIRIGSTTGEVISIDLLSVKLRTLDNLYVRIANENLIKSEITNLHRFPIRRVDIIVGIDYNEDLKRVMDVLLDVADRNPLCLNEPRPQLIYQGFNESSIDIQFSAWAKQENFLEVKNGMYVEIKEAFDRQGISIPFPQRTVHMVQVQ